MPLVDLRMTVMLPNEEQFVSSSVSKISFCGKDSVHLTTLTLQNGERSQASILSEQYVGRTQGRVSTHCS